MAAVSVIVPVYNVENYLERCLESILAQSFTDFELILVDDGSTDGSGSICDEFAKIDQRISVLHQINQGVSVARNRGIAESRGKWISFIDSDDYILPDYLQVLYLGTLKSDTDMVMTGIKHIFENDSQREVVREWPEIVVRKDNLDVLYEKSILQYQKGPVIKLFKNEIIKENGLCFNERLSRGEDALFVYQYLLHAKIVSVVPGANYVYYKRGGSLMSQQLASFESELYAYECMKPIILQLLCQAEINHPYPRSFLVYWFERVVNSLYLGEKKYGFKDRLKFLRSLNYEYYRAWKLPVSTNEMILKTLLTKSHFVLYDLIVRLFA